MTRGCSDRFPLIVFRLTNGRSFWLLVDCWQPWVAHPLPTQTQDKTMISKTLSIIGITMLVAGASQASIVANLQEYWPLDGNANATQDPTFNATFTGDVETYVAGKFGQGIDLERDGIQDYLTVGGVGDEFDHVGGSVTVSLWVSTESLATGWQALISNGEGSAWRLARRDEHAMTGVRGRSPGHSRRSI